MTRTTTAVMVILLFNCTECQSRFVSILVVVASFYSYALLYIQHEKSIFPHPLCTLKRRNYCVYLSFSFPVCVSVCVCGWIDFFFWNTLSYFCFSFLIFRFVHFLSFSPLVIVSFDIRSHGVSLDCFVFSFNLWLQFLILICETDTSFHRHSNWGKENSSSSNNSDIHTQNKSKSKSNSQMWNFFCFDPNEIRTKFSVLCMYLQSFFNPNICIFFAYFSLSFTLFRSQMEFGWSLSLDVAVLVCMYLCVSLCVYVWFYYSCRVSQMNSCQCWNRNISIDLL